MYLVTDKKKWVFKLTFAIRHEVLPWDIPWVRLPLQDHHHFIVPNIHYINLNREGLTWLYSACLLLMAPCKPAAARPPPSAAQLNGQEQRETEIPSGTKIIYADIPGLKADLITSVAGEEMKVGHCTGFLFRGEICCTAGCRQEHIWLPSA